MAELVYAYDSKSYGAIHESSSLSRGTKTLKNKNRKMENQNLKKDLEKELQEIKEFYRSKKNKYILEKMEEIENDFEERKIELIKKANAYISLIKKEYGAMPSMSLVKRIIKSEEEKKERHLISLEKIKISTIENLKSLLYNRPPGLFFIF